MKTEKNASYSTILKVTLTNLIIFFVISAVIIALLSFIFFKFDNPKAYTSVISIAAIAISSIISGVIQSKRLSEHSSLLASALLSVTVVIFMFILSLISSAEGKNDDYLKFIIIPCAITLGCLLGKKRKDKKRGKFYKHK